MAQVAVNTLCRKLPTVAQFCAVDTPRDKGNSREKHSSGYQSKCPNSDASPLSQASCGMSSPMSCFRTPYDPSCVSRLPREEGRQGATLCGNGLVPHDLQPNWKAPRNLDKPAPKLTNPVARPRHRLSRVYAEVECRDITLGGLLRATSFKGLGTGTQRS